MIVQKSGMMSSQNPLSTTTRYYVNDYEAKRNGPSVANTQKQWGEGQRETYLRTGVESKNNPFAQNVDTYYQDYKGKKVEEIAEKPQPKAPRYQTYML